MSDKSFISRRFHFIVDAFGCDIELLSDETFLTNLIKEISTLLDMTIIKGPEIAKGIPENPGLTAFAIIDFSHISIHTFTNSKEFCLDIFSCKQFDYKKLENYVLKIFKLKKNQIFKSIVRYDQFNIERDKNDFSPSDYLKEYYQDLGNENAQILQWYNRIYSNIDSNQSLLEVGGGPTIYQLISATNKVTSITFTDCFEKNLAVIKKWKEQPDNFWDKFIAYTLGLERESNGATNKYSKKRSCEQNKENNLFRHWFSQQTVCKQI